MGFSCCVAECTNSKKVKVQRGAELVFHRFPVKNQSLCKLWLTKCHRAEKLNIGNCCICSDHFTPADYKDDMMNRLLGLPTRKLLKDGAVPSIFPGRKVPAPKKARSLTRQRKQIIESILANSDLPPNTTKVGGEDESKTFGTFHLCPDDTSAPLTFSKLHSELKTLESALCALRKCETRFNVALQWITRFYGEVPDDLRADIEAVDSDSDCESPPSWNQTSDELDSQHSFGFPDTPSPLPMEFEEIEVKPDISSVQLHQSESETNCVKLVDIGKLLEPENIVDVDIKTEIEEDVNKCDHCAATFDSLHQLSVHDLIHSKIRLTRVRKDKNNLAGKKPKQRLKIKVVTKKPNSEFNSASPQLTPTKEFGERNKKIQEDLQCQYCQCRFSSKTELSAHSRTVHRRRLRF